MKYIVNILLFIILVCTSAYLINDADKLKTGFVVYDKNLKAYQIKLKKPKGWTSLREVSKEALWAIIVSEDWAFYDHKGIDLRQLKEAIEDTLTQGERLRGASTISQQVVKNALYSNNRSYIRKIKEMIATFKLENNLNKNEILEQYINLIELGKGIYGVKEAAKYYFDKSPKNLSPKEGAFLAMLLPSPKKYSISFRERELSNYATTIIENILIKLRQANIISEQTRIEESQKHLSFEDAKIVEDYF